MEQKRQNNSYYRCSSNNSYCGSKTSTTTTTTGNSETPSDYFMQVEEQINRKSRRDAEIYLKVNDLCDKKDDKDDSSCSTSSNKHFGQVFLVYKFVNTPVDMLIEGMKRMMKDQATKYFRKLAIQLHPDKNSHPMAKDAFQKLAAALQAVAVSSATRCA